MRGDFTRDTRERAHRLSTRAILLQQGRQLLDADWNAQAGLTAARAEKTAIDAIGRQGAPREDAGFGIDGGVETLAIGAGSLYVEGLRCHNPAPTSYTTQLAAGILPELVATLPAGEEGLVYLEAGTRPAMEADDPLLPEPGLGGADTVVQEVVGWTVRVAPLAGIGMSRDALITAIDRNQPVSLVPWGRTTGGLSADVQTEDEVTDPGPCTIPATAGYLDQVNRLFRIEIHQSGAPGAATFKWAEDGGVEARLRSEGAGFAVDLSPERAAALFPQGAVVEIVDRDRQRAGVPGPVGRITSDAGAALTIDGVPGSALGAEVRIRRWAASPQVIPAGNAWVALSHGVKIRFAPGHYQRGAGWTVPARTRTGDILWPPYPQPDQTVAIAGEGSVGFYAPGDGERRYAALGLVRRSGTAFSVVRDLRQVFAPLTDLTADLVRYDSTGTDLVSTDVQAAITELSTRSGDHCTYSATPGRGWEQVFDRIPAGANATVCLPVGNYPLTSPVEISGKGRIRLIGAGLGSKVWCYGDTVALRFRDCRSLDVADITIAAENRSPWKPRRGSMTAGALDVAACGTVRVERTTLIGAGTRWRQSVCLRIDADAGPKRVAGDVLISDCDLVAGDLAGGILVLNAATARIRDNRIRPRHEDRLRTLQRWADDPTASASMARLLFSNGVQNDGVNRPRTRADTRLYRQVVRLLGRELGWFAFVTLDMVDDATWDTFLRAYARRAQGMRSAKEAILDIRHLLGGLWAGRGRIVADHIDFNGFRGVYDRLASLVAPVIDAGIVVAGTSAGDIAVSGNAIDGALQGIRIAVSQGNRTGLRMRTVRVESNVLRLAVVPLDRPRHGIYVGNAERAWVVDNDIAIETADRPDARASQAAKEGLDRLFSEGIRVYGRLGLMLQVRGNLVQGCRDGITVWSFTNPSQRLRLLDGNMISNASTPWRISGGATRVNNIPT